MIGTRSQQIFNVRSTPPNFCGCPLYVFGVLRCHTRTSWQCLGWCNLRIAERIAGGRSASTMCSRSKVTRYGQFCCSTKIAPGRSQMDGSCTDMV